MVKISKELFVATLNAIKEGHDEQMEFDKAMSKFSDGYFISTIGNKWLNALIALLEDSVGDEVSRKYGSTISWWLYEDTVIDKIIYLSAEHPNNNTGKELEIKVNTPEELYTYFSEYN